MMNRFEVAECVLRRRGRAAVRVLLPILLPVLAGILLAGCQGKPAEVADKPQPEAAVKQVTCKGKVVHPDGRPIEGATVTAYKWVRKYRMVHSEPQAIAEVTTKADGSFSFRARAGEQGVSMLAHKKGLALGWADLRFGVGKLEATIELVRARTLAGKVVDEAGRPIRGAKVIMSLRPARRVSGRGWLAGHAEIPQLVRQTGADGRFSFDNVPAQYEGEFHVRAPGRAMLDTSFRGRRRTPRPRGEEIKLSLAVGANIEAVAVEKATGKPVGDVALVAVNYRAIEPQLGVCISKKDGRYRWEGLPAGSYELALPNPTRSAAEWAADPVKVKAKPGETATGKKIELIRGGLAEVAVIDAENGKPIEHPNVGLWQKGKRWFQFAGAGKDGIVRVRLVPGEYNISYVTAWRYSSFRSAGKVTVVEGKASRIEVKLKKAPRLHGVVRDEAGKPAPGTMLWVAGDYDCVEADSDGKFEIWRGYLGRGRRVSSLLLARHPDRNLAAAVEVRDVSKPLDVKLRPGLTLAAEVLGPGGRPIPKAEITVLSDDSDPQPYLPLAEGTTGPDGRCRITALLPGRDCPVLARAEGYGAGDLLLRARTSPASLAVKHTFRLRPVKQDAAAPVVRRIAVPEIPGGWAVWGATGRDSRGHIWFGVTAHEIECPSAHLFEYVPKTGKLIDRGNVVDELKRAGVYRKGEGQMKIHSKIIQAADGHLYFASMDEQGEDEDTGKLPKWGGHLWRLKLKDNSWEHLLTVPEALIAVAGSGKFVYAMGYWDHALYQYDTATGKTRSVKVGALVAHVSRNILCDRNGHVYVPRVKAGAGGVLTAALVEYDTSLKEIGETPLRYYFEGRPRYSHGIIGLQTLPDGAIAFLTHNGYLSMIRPSATGPAKVTDIGWFHPDGPKYAGSLFADDTGRFLMSAVRRGWERPYEWVVYDLKTRSQSLAEIKVSRPKGLDLGRASLYGSATRDDAGNCYVVGVNSEGEEERVSRPIVLQISPAKPKPIDAK